MVLKQNRPSKVMYCRQVKHGFTVIYYVLGISNYMVFERSKVMISKIELTNRRMDSEYTKAKEEACFPKKLCKSVPKKLEFCFSILARRGTFWGI